MWGVVARLLNIAPCVLSVCAVNLGVVLFLHGAPVRAIHRWSFTVRINLPVTGVEQTFPEHQRLI